MLHLIIYSGGLDSYTLLHSVLHNNRFDAASQFIALSFDYGQRHRKELESARKVCRGLGIEHIVTPLDLAGVLAGSALTSAEVAVPEGHYAEASMKQTVVAGRNTIMLSIAMGIAEARVLAGRAPRAAVYYGAHAGDHAIYPDCRPGYISAMVAAFEAATEERVRLRAPFINIDKGDILHEGQRVGLQAWNYAETWTCYKGEAQPCGKCGACTERVEAFDKIGWEDPLMARAKAP